MIPRSVVEVVLEQDMIGIDDNQKPAKLDPALHNGPRRNVAYSEYVLLHEMEEKGRERLFFSRINTDLAHFHLEKF